MFDRVYMLVATFTGFLVCAVTSSDELFTCNGLIYRGRCYWVTNDRQSYDQHSCNKTSLPNLDTNNIIIMGLKKTLSSHEEVYIEADTSLLNSSHWTFWKEFYPGSGSDDSSSEQSGEYKITNGRYCGYLDVEWAKYMWVRGVCSVPRYALCDMIHYDSWGEWGPWSPCSFETKTHSRNRSCLGQRCNELILEDGVVETQSDVGTCQAERSYQLAALPGRLLDYSTEIISGVDSSISCASYCTSHYSTCTSINYEAKEKLCELNSKKGQLKSSDLVETNVKHWVNFEFIVVEIQEEN